MKTIIPPDPFSLRVVRTPAFGIPKYLVPIIFPITTNSFTVRDSFSFARQISCQTFNSNFYFYMSSFDVTPLFTSIPFQETIDIILFEIFDLFDNSQCKMKNNPNLFLVW